MNLKNILIRQPNFSYNVDLLKNDELKIVTDVEISNFFDFQVSEYMKDIDFKINLPELTDLSIEQQIVLSFAKSLQDEWKESKANIDTLKKEFQKFNILTGKIVE